MPNFLHEEKIPFFVRLNHYILLNTPVWKLKSLLANFPMVWKWSPKILVLNLNLTVLPNCCHPNCCHTKCGYFVIFGNFPAIQTYMCIANDNSLILVYIGICVLVYLCTCVVVYLYIYENLPKFTQFT